LVDEADVELISRHNWSITNGYVKSGRTLMHRFILGVTDPNKHIDHIDHNRLNNQRSNLRICTRSENQHNRVKQKSTSRFKGVTRYAGKWFAQIRHNNEYIYLGLYNSEVTAAKCYDRASRELHKDFGLTNFKDIENIPRQLAFYFRDTTSARRTSIKLIERAVREKWIKELAFYHLMKYHFNNSCVYAYRSRMDELAAQFDVSTKTLYNYLNLLRSKDLINDHSHNLKIKSIRQFETMKVLLNIEADYNLFDISCLLYNKLIERKAKQQAFAESVRRFGRGDRYNSRPCENPFRPSLSYRSIAKLLNISECKAFKIIQNLNRLGVIRTNKQKPVLRSKNFSNLKSIEDLPGYRFNIGTKLFELYGMQFEFLQYPVTLKKITSHQYNKFINSHL
jgi:hypothetical protein